MTSNLFITIESFTKLHFYPAANINFGSENKRKAENTAWRKSLNFLPVIFFNCLVIYISGGHFQTRCSTGVKKCHQCSGCWYSITEMIIKSSPSTEYVARCPSALQLQFTTLCCSNNCLLKIGSCKKGTRSMKPAEEEEVEPSEAVSHLFSLMIIMCMSS